YMSPEQLRGEPADVRSDLFSLGLVVYEMATGRPAFGGATSAVIAAAILERTPTPPRTVRADLPAPLEQVILKAIEKDRELRYQHASEMRADLQRLKRSADVLPVRARRRALPIAAAVVALAAIAGGAYVYFHRPSPLTDKDTIVLADFRNTTGDEVFDE